MKFPSHLKCDGKIVSEMGPRNTINGHFLLTKRVRLSILKKKTIFFHKKWALRPTYASEVKRPPHEA